MSDTNQHGPERSEEERAKLERAELRRAAGYALGLLEIIDEEDMLRASLRKSVLAMLNDPDNVEAEREALRAAYWLGKIRNRLEEHNEYFHDFWVYQCEVLTLDGDEAALAGVAK